MSKKAFQNDMFESAFELENSWTPINEAQPLTQEQVDSIKEVRIRRKTTDSYVIVNAICFFIDATKKPKSLKISPYCDAFEFDNGTKIDPESIELQMFEDMEGDQKVFCVAAEEL